MKHVNRLAAVLVTVLLVSGTALAHKVNLFAYAGKGTVFTESYFPDGRAVEKGKVLVYDSKDQLLLEGETDTDGLFSFDIPKVDALTIVIDSIGVRINPAFYKGNIPYDFGILFENLSHSWLTIVGNLFLLQGHHPLIPTLGTNGPLWSLAYEGIYYAIYPLAYLPLYRRLGPHGALAVSLAISLTSFSLLFVDRLGSLRILRIFVKGDRKKIMRCAQNECRKN